MRVLVLGGRGYVGRAVVAALRQAGHQVQVASRQPGAEGPVVDVQQARSLRPALRDVDAVVNASTGSATVITQGASALCQAMGEAGVGRLVHFSSQAVYGAQEGDVDEQVPLQPSLGWYGQAKIAAEQTVQAWAQQGGQAVILRPGCVAGWGSPLWDGRIQQWLQRGWLGDLGASGDGWSNLVHVADLAQAVVCSLDDTRMTDRPRGAAQVFNLAAPDAPRWNGYFQDLALRDGLQPLARISARQLRWIALAYGVPLKLWERLHGRGLLPTPPLQGMPPSVARLWAQQIRLDGQRMAREGGLVYTPYAQLLKEVGCP